MTITKQSKNYIKALKAFKKQFDCVEITKLYVSEGKVIGGEWLDSNGVTNFSSGCFDCQTVEIQ